MIPLLIALAVPVPASAGRVDARLLSARAAAAPGEAFDAGLRLRMRDGWHVYWRNPGDSGLAPTLDWRLPSGWKASPLEWPSPRRIELPPLTNFGYEGEVVLPFVLEAPASAKGRTTLSARAEWLECKELCVPGAADVSLSVAIAESPKPSEHAAALSAARRSLPSKDPALAVKAVADGNAVKLIVPGRRPRDEFFPFSGELFRSKRPSVIVTPNSTEHVVLKTEGAPHASVLEGVLVGADGQAVEISAAVSSGGALLRHLLLAFLGGLLLNLMPCVFPVLGFKALGLLSRAGGEPSRARLHAALYAAGVILGFEALAGALAFARSAGASVGWGFQLQSPPFVAVLAFVFMAAGANLLGLFELGSRWTGLGSSLSSKEGNSGSFFSGLFAVVAAAPCTAPFMGAALAWSLTRPGPEIMAVFASLGAGMAAPYAALASWPALLRRLPRPGPWMVSLKKLMSVPMFATAAWLLLVLSRLLGAAPAGAGGPWKEWSPEAVQASRAAGRSSFTDFTAAWCLTCQFNKLNALSDPRVVAALSRPDVDAFRADWTARDERVARALAAYGREGVPLYVIHARGREPVILPEILTPELVLDALETDKGGSP